MRMTASLDGVVYTETIVYAPIERYAAAAPYQLAIIDLENGDRVTVRVIEPRVVINDRVTFLEEREGVAYYQKAETSR